MQARTPASNRLAKANRASRWSTREGKGKSKENKGKFEGQSKGTKGATGSHKGKTSRNGLSGLGISTSETSLETRESVHMGVCTTDTSWIRGEWSPDEWNDGWSFDEGNDDWSSVGWHEDCEQTYDTSVSSFSPGSFDIGVKSSPWRFEWVKINLDAGAAVNTFPLNSSLERIGDGRFYQTASGEWIPDGGAWQIQGYDENGSPRSLSCSVLRRTFDSRETRMAEQCARKSNDNL